MFEDSLVESVGRIRTRSPRYVAGSFIAEAALVAIFVLIPFLDPAALPRKFLTVPILVPPPPPPALSAEPHRALNTAAARPQLLTGMLVAPSRIPQRIVKPTDLPLAPDIPGNLDPGAANRSVGAPWLTGVLSAPQVRLAKPSGPLRVSAGVAAGQLLAPIRPRYPAIALAAHVQGTVVVAATISADGRIQSLRALSGPPLLIGAALDAIRQARYRPWTLNGEPVEVATTIDIVFTLGN